MDRTSLVSTFTEAAKVGWSLSSDVQVLKWLDDFANKLQKRADRVTEEVHKLVEQTGAVEQDLLNTFNYFRGLSNIQFIENRVCEEDEMDAQNSDFTFEFSEVCVPAQSYEEDIIPRYKEALFSGWNAYKEHLQKTYRNTSTPLPHKVGWSYGQLPHIIGTDEFMRDNSCGLTVSEEWSSGMEPLEFDSDAEREGIQLAAEMAGTSTLLEGDLSGTESDRDDPAGMEPAVSAALDFKAMLEAALRSPYIPYADDILSNLNRSSGYYGNMDYGLPASAVSVDSLRNGSPKKQHELDKNQDVFKGINATNGVGEDVQISDFIAGTTAALASTESVPEELHPEHSSVSKEAQPKSSKISRQADVSSEALDAKCQSDSSGFSIRLHEAVLSGGLFDNEDEPSSSAASEYVHVQSQPVEICPIIKHDNAHIKEKLKFPLKPEQISISSEVKNDKSQSSSSLTRRKLNAAVISGGVFHNGEQSTSSSPQPGHVSSKPIEASCSPDLIQPKCTGRASERDTPREGPGKNVYDSSTFSSHLHAALASGGLFDDDDKLISSSPMESICIWSQPTVPEGLFDPISGAEKNEVSPSSSVKSGLIQTGPNLQEKINAANIKVSVGKSEFPGAKHVEQTLQSKDQFDAAVQILNSEARVLPLQKQQSGNQTLKKSPSLFQTGLFDDGETEEDDEPVNLFRAESALQQKCRLQEASLASETSVKQGSFIAAGKFNAQIAPLTSLSEKNKGDGLHGIDGGTFGRTSLPHQYPSNLATRVQIAGIKGGTSDLDDGKKFSLPVNLVVNDRLDPKSDPFPDTLTSLYKEELLPYSVAATSTLNQSEYDSDSWSSSSSERNIKSNPIILSKFQSTKVSNSEINNDPCESVSSDAKGIAGPLGDTASMLQVNGSVNIPADVSVLESIDGSTERTKEDTGNNKHSPPASLTDVESISIDPSLNKNRVTPTTTLNDQMDDLFEAKKRHESWSQGTQVKVEGPSVNESDAYTMPFHPLASSTLIGRNLGDGASSSVFGSVSLMNENIITTDKSAAVGTPERTDFRSSNGQTDSLLVNEDLLQDSSEHSLAELNVVSRNGQVVLGIPHQASVAFREFTKRSQGVLSSKPSTSMADRSDGRDIYLSPSDEETKSKLGSGTLSHHEGLTKAPALIQETKVPPMSSLLFGDLDEEEEGGLFGPLPKTNPMIASLLKSPGKCPSLFDSDEE